MNIRREVVFGERLVNLLNGSVQAPEPVKRLTPRELELLVYLLNRPAQIVSREELLVHVWGYHPDTQTRAVDSTLMRLRKKLEHDHKHPEFLQSVYGEGYRLNVPAQLRSAPDVERVEEPTRGADPLGPGWRFLIDAILPNETTGPEEDDFPAEITEEVLSPLEATGLIGRDDVRVTLRGLTEDAGLVSVVGPPGVGKSALVDVVLPEAVRIDTAALQEGTLLSAVVSALCLEVAPNAGIDGVIRGLAALGRLHLWLDGAEQLSEQDRELLARVQADTHQLTIICTRARPLELRGERVLELFPLSADGAESDAVKLLLRELGPGSWPTDSLMQLARRYDGIPLALKLVARRARFLGLEAVLAQGEAQTGLDTPLAMSISQALEELTARQRTLLTAGSVFAGRFDLEDVRVFVPDTPVEQLLDDLEVLMTRSLLLSEVGARPLKFRVLGPIRLHLCASLSSQAQSSLFELHARHCLARFAHPAAKALQVRYAYRQRALEELYAAASRPGIPTDTAARCAVLVCQTLWDTHGTQLAEGLLDRDGLCTEVSQLVAYQLGFTRFKLGRASYRSVMEEAWEQAQGTMRVLLGLRLMTLLWVAEGRDAASTVYEATCRDFEVLGDPPEWIEAWLLVSGASIEWPTSPEARLPMNLRAVRAVEELTDSRYFIEAVRALAGVYLALGRGEEALGQLRRIWDHTKTRAVDLQTEVTFGNLLLVQGAFSEAVEVLEHCIRRASRIGNTHMMASTVLLRTQALVHLARSAEALEPLGEVLARGAGMYSPSVMRIPRAWYALAQAKTGRPSEASRLLEAGAPHGVHDHEDDLVFALLAESVSDRAAARQVLEQVEKVRTPRWRQQRARLATWVASEA